MTPEDRQAFAAIVTGMSEMKGRTLTAAGFGLYWQSMRDWHIDDFRDAAARLMKTCEWMPTPKEFEDLRIAGRPTAGEHWAKILNAARKGEGGFTLDAPAARALAAIGGLSAVEISETSKTHFLEKRFSDHFAEMQSVHDTRHAVPQIAATPIVVQTLAAQMLIGKDD
jgi:hypothetical protein